MLTDTQVQVLSAINDHCEVHERLTLDPARPMPEVIADLGLVDKEVFQAAGDLYELGLIKGVPTSEFAHPVVVFGLTAHGRQELP